MRYILLIGLIIVSTPVPSAEKQALVPGAYILDGDSGTLTLRKEAQNKLSFDISSIGANCHTCSLSGQISGLIGNTNEDGASRCEVSFSASGSHVVVKPITEDTCREYCGMRAGFDGTYRKPPKACTGEGRKKQHNQFMRLYRAHQYSQAEDALQRLVSQCKQFMHWIEIDQMRNDLALTQYHRGDSLRCLATLKETLAAQVKSEDELKSGAGDVYLPPCDFDNYLSVAKSTWFNKAMCSKAVR